MNTLIAEQLNDSAQDFVSIVWPHISTTPIVNGGRILPVEAFAEREFKEELDLLAGIDALQVQYSPTAMRGLASRVQWGVRHDSFTIRTRLPSGQETEFHKRLRAIRNRDEGHLYPHLTIQAFLSERRGTLLSAAAIRTLELIETASILVENRESLRPRPDLYGFVLNPDGTEFLFLKWKYLIFKGVLDIANIIDPSA